MDTLTLAQGRSLDFLVQLRDSSGAVLANRYDGSEPLALVVWAGDDMAPVVLALSGVTWGGTANDGTEFTAAAGVVRVSLDEADFFDADDLPVLEPGIYRLVVVLQDNGRHYDAYRAILKIVASAGAAAARPVYCTAEDIRGRATWIDRLLDEAEDQTGFAEQRAQARIDIEQTLLARIEAAPARAVGPGAWTLDPALERAIDWTAWPDERRTSLATHLAADRLVRDGRLVEIAALLTLGRILAPQLGAAADQTSYQTLGAKFTAQGRRQLVGYSAGIDTDGDGVADFVVG